MDRARGAALRRRHPRSVAGGRDAALEAGLAHPAFDAVRPWLARLADPLDASLEELNALAHERRIRVASGAPLRFVAPMAEQAAYGEYELRIFRTGGVATRAGNRHDLFNALAWLAFPRAKAALNARHAAEIPLEGGRRGRLRDLLTLLDEGGALVTCADEELLELLHARRWKELFWDRREELRRHFRVAVLGHAVLEQALDPWPGITCKALVVAGAEADAAAADWICAMGRGASPRDLPPLPVFGLPGWHAGSDEAGFYEDGRYFRGARKIAPGSRPGSRYGDIEESPGSAERDAG